MRRTLFLLLLALTVSASPRPRGGVAAAAGPRVVVTAVRAEDLVLDGKPDEAAWAKAPVIPAEPLGDKAPVVRLLVAKGSLWVAVEAAEDPGFAIGVRVMVAAEGTASTGDAVALSYAPLDLRGPRFVARGPRGVGRSTYRFGGAADLRRLDAWTVEARLPIADLGLEGDTTPIALAVVAAGRTPNLLAAAPEGSLFNGPATFAKVLPPDGGWRASEDPGVDGSVLAGEDVADADRLQAWSEFLTARSGVTSVEEARVKLLGPIDRALARRPDLVSLRWVRGTVRALMGETAAAAAEQQAVLAAVPGFREARFALDEITAARWTESEESGPSDYEAAFARFRAEGERLGPRSVATRLAEGILRYRRGDFVEASALLDPLVAAYPVGAETEGKARYAKAYREAWGQELGFRKADEAKGDLPRVRLSTSKGDVLLELFEDDAPNSVRNFVWLARAGCYADRPFHRVIPFFMAQGGDTSRGEGASRASGPGYAIKTEPSRRRPFRGVVAMARGGLPDTEGSQFFVTTGTSAHLEGEYSVFGRVLEGQDVVDRIVVGDVLRAVEIVRVRARTTYHPLTVAGTPAPPPACAR